MTSDSEPASTLVRRGAILNVLANWGGLAVAAVTAFLLTPYVVHRLGDAQYGVWALLGSIVAYLGLLDVGVRSAVTRSVASRAASGRHQEASRELGAALIVFAGTGLGAVGLSVLLALFGLAVFDLPASLIGPARTCLVLGGVTTAVSMIGGVFGGVVVGRQRFDLLAGVEVTATVGRALAVVAVLSWGQGIVALAWVQLGVALLTGAALFQLSRWLYPELHVRTGRRLRAEIRSMTSYGLSVWLVHLSATFVRNADPLVIGAFLPVAQVTFYVIAATLTDYTRQLVAGISRTLSPLASELEGRDRVAEAPMVILRAARYANLIAAPILVTLLLRGERLIAVWMGEGYHEPAGDVLVLLVLARWLTIGFQVCNSTLMGLDRHRGIVPAMVLEAVANLALSVALVGAYGIVGVAVGTLIPRVVMTLGVGPLYARARIGLPIGRFLLRSLVQPVSAMLPFALVSLWIETTWPTTHLWTYLAQVVGALPVAGIGAWWLGLDRIERAAWGPALAARLRAPFS